MTETVMDEPTIEELADLDRRIRELERELDRLRTRRREARRLRFPGAWTKRRRPDFTPRLAEQEDDR